MTSRNEKPMILIVDDILSNIQILAEALCSDYRIKVANNGENAFKIALREQPDLILLDVMMPQTNGFEVCRRLKENLDTHKIPVIFVTCLNSEIDEEMGLNLGAVDYITKPVMIPTTKMRIRNHILLKQQMDLLESLALIDGLTHIANRRRFDETLEKEWASAKRNEAPLSLIMIDIDHFKKYNDHYGHGEGDLCLKKVALRLSSSLVRPCDLIARYGGEEFVVILPNTPQIAALQIAERLRASIEQLGLPHAYAKAMVTISLGVATLLKIPENSLPSLLNDAADRALYKAKENGRNQVSYLG